MWIRQDLTGDQSTLVQVMAWCRQATSHHLDQWWTIFMLSYGVMKSQWVKDVLGLPMRVRACVARSPLDIESILHNGNWILVLTTKVRNIMWYYKCGSIPEYVIVEQCLIRYLFVLLWYRRYETCPCRAKTLALQPLSTKFPDDEGLC